MEHCSRYMGNGEGCYGIVWVEVDGACWIRNSTTGTANIIKKDGHYAALVNDGQLTGFDTTCPGPDASIHELSGVSGLAYTLNCNKVVSGFDLCSSGYPKPCLDSPYQGFFHTKSLDECLRICVDQHPLCKAVSWSPDLKIGFANCFLKAGFPETLTSPGPKNGILHSATITRIDPINRECPTSKTYTSSSKKFDIHCGQVNTGTNITSVHSQNLTSCMDTCAKSDQKCVGVVFDSSLNGGYNNCYLQNSTSTFADQASATYASLSGSGAPSGTGSPDSNSNPPSSPSKAWIAGPVIGGIAALALIAFLIFWWRRRKSKYAAAAIEKDGHEFGRYGAAPAYSPGGGSGHAQLYDAHASHAAPPMELGGHDQYAMELPASTKYAHTAKNTPQELPS